VRGMIVYGDPSVEATVAEALSALAGLQGDDRLVAEGMLEQALADGGFENAEEIPADVLLRFKTPEGFAFYGLTPEQYRRAARRWMSKNRARGDVIVIGIRSIGTTLSRVVTEELLAGGVSARRCTVRTEGDPFCRSVRLPEWIHAKAAAYLVVDEGPGMSGSSFLSVSAELRKRGVGRERIHFFPSHDGLPGKAATAQVLAEWKQFARWIEPALAPPLNPALNWQFIGPSAPAPFDCSGRAEYFARRNAERSCGVPVVERNGWWLAFAKVAGEPARVDAATLARHIEATADAPLPIKDELETERRLREMLVVNVEKHFRDAALTGALRRWLDGLIIEHGRASSADGHLEPENWSKDASGRLWKLQTTGSGLSHFVAYRLPVWWDVAQAMLEWDFDDEMLRELKAAGLECDPRTLAFFKMANAAFELGKSVMFSKGDIVRRQERLWRVLEGELAL
jgi:hypothetical protein